VLQSGLRSESVAKSRVAWIAEFSYIQDTLGDQRTRTQGRQTLPWRFLAELHQPNWTEHQQRRVRNFRVSNYSISMSVTHVLLTVTTLVASVRICSRNDSIAFSPVLCWANQAKLEISHNSLQLTLHLTLSCEGLSFRVVVAGDLVMLVCQYHDIMRDSFRLKTRKPSCRWQTRATLAKSLHGLRNSSGVVSCIARLPIDSVPIVSYYVLYSNCVCKMRRFGDTRLLKLPWNPGQGSFKVIETDTIR